MSDNQSKDKEILTTKINELNGFIKQIDELKTALTKAEKSKTDTDIKTVQKLLDSMTNDYLKEDKETAIKNLDKLKASIKEEQAKVEADKKAVAKTSAQQQVENETQLQGEQETSNQQSYNEAPQQNYQEPTQTYQEPIQQAPAQQAPSGGGASQNTAAQQAAQNAQNNTNNNNGIMGNEAPNGGQMETPGWGF
ncbi:hypothetical protein [Lactococcus lactis]|uniref:hypothetical protein n=1 Tax=Lactococcus lactis TaxID=1358 RepID=UPI0024A96D92|nr:hypothetical protein [Lactococcus lactis]